MLRSLNCNLVRYRYPVKFHIIPQIRPGSIYGIKYVCCNTAIHNTEKRVLCLIFLFIFQLFLFFAGVAPDVICFGVDVPVTDRLKVIQVIEVLLIQVFRNFLRRLFQKSWLWELNFLRSSVAIFGKFLYHLAVNLDNYLVKGWDKMAGLRQLMQNWAGKVRRYKLVIVKNTDVVELLFS